MIIIIPKIVKPGFCAIHFTITFAGQTNVDRYTGNIVIPKIAKSGFDYIVVVIVLIVPYM